jgi:hypothetical protein
VTEDLASLDVGVDGAKVLAEVHAVLIRYVVFPCPEAADAAVLYAAATPRGERPRICVPAGHQVPGKALRQVAPPGRPSPAGQQPAGHR